MEIFVGEVIIPHAAIILCPYLYVFHQRYFGYLLLSSNLTVF
jgi:hypothetical protein